jgi:hypothetical protein
MKLKFSLSPDYDIEDGYRNLEILIFGGGCNYISVFARLDWTVIRNEWSSGDGLLPGKEYIEGRTSWVLRCCHDSCWRDAVGSLLHEFGGRITSIDWVFGGWYKTVPVSDEERKMFSSMSQSDRIDLADLEFKFDKTASD